MPGGELRCRSQTINGYAKLAAAGRLAAAAPLGARGIGGRLADELGVHQASHEELLAVIVKINGRALGIGIGHYSEAVLLMLDLLPCGKYLHDLPPFFQAGLQVQPASGM